MVAKKIQRKMFKLLGDRRGTAEIVGSVMFLVIIFFVFTNVYMWHDSVSHEMNGVLAEKLNSPVSIDVDDTGTGLVVTNNGGFEVGLSRLWLITGSGSESDHVYVDLEPLNVRIAAGAKILLIFGYETNLHLYVLPDGTRTVEVEVNYLVTAPSVMCKILTSLGNMAACTYP